MTGTTTDRRRGLTGSTAIKAPCRVATTAAITLSGEQTVDGVAVVSGDRALVKDQSSGVDNGIYDVSTGSWTRAPDWDGTYDIRSGTFVYVTSGTQSGFWYVTTADPILVGTTSVTIAQASSVLAAFSAYIQGLLDDADEDAAKATLKAAHRGYPVDNLIQNGDFTLWTARPASGSIQSPGSGVGFTLGDICDGWYAGPGATSQFTFTNPLDDTATGARSCKLAWDASVSAGEAQHNVTGQITSSYWRFSFLEYNQRAEPGYYAGKTITVEFDAKASDSYTIVPVAFLSMGNSAWAASTAYYVGDIVLADAGNGEFGGNRVYVCTTAGTSAGSGGPSGTSSSISDNTVVWDYVGEEKGREYEIYEAGASAGTAQIAWGDPVAAARCAVTTSWQTFRKQIYIPDLNDTTGTEYSGQSNDNGARSLTAPAGLGAYFGIAFDLWHNASIGPTIEIRDVRVWVGDEVQTEDVKLPRDLKMLASNGFSRMADLYRPYATQAQMEAGTANTATVTPGRQHFHNSAAKFWATWESSGTTLAGAYNVTSVTNTGVGNETLVIATDFSASNWVAAGMAATANSTDPTAGRLVSHASKAAGSLTIIITDQTTGPAFADASVNIVGFGDHA